MAGDDNNPDRPGRTGEQGGCDLGVLFVHGIGTQRRGDTLSRSAAAVYRSLDSWCASQSGDGRRALIGETWLAAGDDEAAGPARCRLLLEGAPDAGGQSWLLAESHWADTFHPVRYQQMLWWALVSVPRAVYLHAINPSQSLRTALEIATPGSRAGLVNVDRSVDLTGPEIALRTFAGAAMLILSPLLIALVLLALVLLFILGLVPLEASRNAALNLQRTLAQTLGDSFIFTANPVVEAAVVTRVQRDLLWLAERSRRVVLVAHSQGAAVSYRALQGLVRERQLPAVVTEFVSYGSGLRKLADLDRRKGEGIALYGWCAAALSSGLLFCLSQALLHSSLTWVLAVVALFCLIVLLVVFGTVVLPRPRMENPLPLDWFDFYASRDPVSNGRVDVRFWGAAAATGSGMQFAGGKGHRRESVMVFNRHSLVSDHSTYWDEGTDFTVRILQRFLAGNEATAFDEMQCARVQSAAASRRRRLWQLAGFRAAAGIALGASLLWNRGAVAALGHAISDPVSGMGAGGALPHWLAAQFEVLSSQPLLLGAISLAVPLALVFLVGYWGWLLWDRSAAATLYTGVSAGSGGGLAAGAWLLVISWLSLLAVPPMLFTLATPAAPALPPLVIGLVWFALRFFPGPAVWERTVPPVRPPG